MIKSFGKTKVVESSPPIDCSVCPGLISDLDNLAVEKANLENENTYLRAILSWVSSSEPQLGMMIKQFKRGDGFGVGYTYTKSDFDRLYGKIGKAPSFLRPGKDLPFGCAMTSDKFALCFSSLDSLACVLWLSPSLF